MLKVEPNNLALLKTYYAEFNYITITFTDQNGRPLNWTCLFINWNDTFFLEPRTRKYVKG